MIVLDASALVDVVLGLPNRAWVLAHLKRQEILAPSHQVAEVMSAVARVARSGAIDRGRTAEAMVEVMALGHDLVLPTSAHVRRAIELSDHVRVTDGLYVALAEEHRCPLITTDRRLVSARVDCEVRTPDAD